MTPPRGGRHAAPSLQLPAQTSKAKSALRLFAGTVSIDVGFWGGSAAMDLNSLSAIFGPRFVWFAFCLGFAALYADAGLSRTEGTQPRYRSVSGRRGPDRRR